MGFNGYQHLFRRNVESQRRYAERFGFKYTFIEEPAYTPLLMESTWLKIPLLLAALATGAKWAFYMDTDVEVTARCPDFRCLDEENKDIFLANGHSGRVNAGVMLIKNTGSAQNLLRKILANAGKKVPPEDVAWGDNSNVIHYTKSYPGLKKIPAEWNNNRDPELQDYLRHYSAGPMRPHYRMDEREKHWRGEVEAYIKAHPQQSRPGSAGFYADLAGLFESATRGKPEFGPVDLYSIRTAHRERRKSIFWRLLPSSR